MPWFPPMPWFAATNVIASSLDRVEGQSIHGQIIGFFFGGFFEGDGPVRFDN
jgi:hypothetical protein